MKKHALVNQNSQKSEPKKIAHKKKDQNTDQAPIELTDPTSVTLQNSFLIKNAGPTFDNYHKAMAAQRKKSI